MAGIGSYKKGKAFTLKSGNKPSFKNVGSSPAKHPHTRRRAHGTYGHNTDTGKSVAEGGKARPDNPNYVPPKKKSPAKQTEKEYLAPGGKEGYEGRKKRAGKKYARLVEKKHKVREKGDIALHAGKKRKEERLYKKEERVRQRSIKARKKHQSKQE